MIVNSNSGYPISLNLYLRFFYFPIAGEKVFSFVNFLQISSNTISQHRQYNIENVLWKIDESFTTGNIFNEADLSR